MKIFKIMMVILLFFSCKEQQAQAQYSMSNLTPFLGTWEYQENNQIFRVTIYEDGGYLKGDYELVEVNNGIETLLYESDYYFPGTDFHWGSNLFGGSNDGVKMHAHMVDNSINYANGVTARKFKKGNLGLTILLQTCIDCPTLAEWKVDSWSGLRSDGEPENYNIPTDVIMTKVQ